MRIHIAMAINQPHCMNIWVLPSQSTTATKHKIEDPGYNDVLYWWVVTDLLCWGWHPQMFVTWRYWPAVLGVTSSDVCDVKLLTCSAGGDILRCLWRDVTDLLCWGWHPQTFVTWRYWPAVLVVTSSGVCDVTLLTCCAGGDILRCLWRDVTDLLCWGDILRCLWRDVTDLLCWWWHPQTFVTWCYWPAVLVVTSSDVCDVTLLTCCAGGDILRRLWRDVTDLLCWWWHPQMFVTWRDVTDLLCWWWHPQTFVTWHYWPAVLVVTSSDVCDVTLLTCCAGGDILRCLWCDVTDLLCWWWHPQMFVTWRYWPTVLGVTSSDVCDVTLLTCCAGGDILRRLWRDVTDLLCWWWHPQTFVTWRYWPAGGDILICLWCDVTDLLCWWWHPQTFVTWRYRPAVLVVTSSDVCDMTWRYWPAVLVVTSSDVCDMTLLTCCAGGDILRRLWRDVTDLLCWWWHPQMSVTWHYWPAVLVVTSSDVCDVTLLTCCAGGDILRCLWREVTDLQCWWWHPQMFVTWRYWPTVLGVTSSDVCDVTLLTCCAGGDILRCLWRDVTDLLCWWWHPQMFVTWRYWPAVLGWHPQMFVTWRYWPAVLVVTSSDVCDVMLLTCCAGGDILRRLWRDITDLLCWWWHPQTFVTWRYRPAVLVVTSSDVCDMTWRYWPAVLVVTSSDVCDMTLLTCCAGGDILRRLWRDVTDLLCWWWHPQMFVMWRYWPAVLVVTSSDVCDVTLLTYCAGGDILRRLWRDVTDLLCWWWHPQTLVTWRYWPAVLVVTSSDICDVTLLTCWWWHPHMFVTWRYWPAVLVVTSSDICDVTLPTCCAGGDILRCLWHDVTLLTCCAGGDILRRLWHDITDLLCWWWHPQTFVTWRYWPAVLVVTSSDVCDVTLLTCCAGGDILRRLWRDVTDLLCWWWHPQMFVMWRYWPAVLVVTSSDVCDVTLLTYCAGGDILRRLWRDVTDLLCWWWHPQTLVTWRYWPAVLVVTSSDACDVTLLTCCAGGDILRCLWRDITDLLCWWWHQTFVTWRYWPAVLVVTSSDICDVTLLTCWWWHPHMFVTWRYWPAVLVVTSDACDVTLLTCCGGGDILRCLWCDVTDLLVVTSSDVCDVTLLTCCAGGDIRRLSRDVTDLLCWWWHPQTFVTWHLAAWRCWPAPLMMMWMTQCPDSSTSTLLHLLCWLKNHTILIIFFPYFFLYIEEGYRKSLCK